MAKLYSVLLNDVEIGATRLEKADAPMGVIFGVINFLNTTYNYSFFKNYCLKNDLGFDDYPNDKLISTFDLPFLKVFNENGKEIIGQSRSISGMDSDCFEIYIMGIEYPFYEEEFPHHVKTYNELF